MYKLAPSLLAADSSKLGYCVTQAEKAGVDYIHIDVMDGKFVPCISFGTPVISSIRKVTKIPFDVHLMVDEPERMIKDYVDSGADSITVHAEACTHLHRTISSIKEYGMKAGVALNPATPLNVLEYVIHDLDMILIMSVNPGYGGQKLIPSTIQKLKDTKELLKRTDTKADIQVDGGVQLQNISQLMEAGANIFVAGTCVFNGNISENIKNIKEILNRK